MNFLDRLFASVKNGTQAKESADLERQLRDLEARSKGAPVGTRGTLFNRAGDLCMKVGNQECALHYFGGAIDALLEDHQPEPARAVAKKILRVHPEAVRTLCTLTWLDLAARHHRAAVHHLRDYVKAALGAEREVLARASVLEMASLVRSQEFLEEAAVALEELGAPRDAARVREWVEAGGSPRAEDDPFELSFRCFHAAIGSNLGRKSGGTLS